MSSGVIGFYTDEKGRVRPVVIRKTGKKVNPTTAYIFKRLDELEKIITHLEEPMEDNRVGEAAIRPVKSYYDIVNNEYKRMSRSLGRSDRELIALRLAEIEERIALAEKEIKKITGT